MSREGGEREIQPKDEKKLSTKSEEIKGESSHLQGDNKLRHHDEATNLAAQVAQASDSSFKSQISSIGSKFASTNISQPSSVATSITDTTTISQHSSLGGNDETNTRHVIAVSASKGPAAFFNLARKFLATDEVCDLSALEGAIVSAVDAAHLLERSKLATIERIQTSYVAVESKRKKSSVSTANTSEGGLITQSEFSSHTTSKPPQEEFFSALHRRSGKTSTRNRKSKSGVSSEVRRARIIITVKRTRAYEQWLQENPMPENLDEEEGTDDTCLTKG